MFGQEKVKNVWLVTDTGKLEDKVQRRDAAAFKLEAAETKLIRLANKAHLKALKKQGNVEDAIGLDNMNANEGEPGSIAARWVKAKDRPTHRLTLLIGKKVDTINWSRSEIERLSAKINDLQEKHRAGDAKLVTSVFVEFHSQADAQAAFQSGTFSPPINLIMFRHINLIYLKWPITFLYTWHRVISVLTPPRLSGRICASSGGNV